MFLLESILIGFVLGVLIASIISTILFFNKQYKYLYEYHEVHHILLNTIINESVYMHNAGIDDIDELGLRAYTLNTVCKRFAPAEACIAIYLLEKEQGEILEHINEKISKTIQEVNNEALIIIKSKKEKFHEELQRAAT
jgi:hypothetical protein